MHDMAGTADLSLTLRRIYRDATKNSRTLIQQLEEEAFPVSGLTKAGVLSSVGANGRHSAFEQGSQRDSVEKYELLIRFHKRQKDFLARCLLYQLDPEITRRYGEPGTLPSPLSPAPTVDDSTLFDWMIAHIEDAKVPVGVTSVREDYTDMRLG